MAGTNENQYQQQPYVSPSQQDVLMAFPPSNLYSLNPNYKPDPNDPPLDPMDPNLFTSPQEFGTFDLDDSPFVGDFLDGDTSFDFGDANGELMFGGLPGEAPLDGNGKGAEGGNESGSSSSGNGHDTTEKRKSPGDGAEDVEGGGKRREPDDKTAKKPGRKPLTSEPTTKRKAQNRAAQRAFRERKEKHLKDLEAKVNELEKASDAKNHENGLLRAQVQRLQMELREYRKRLSLNSTGISRSPPVSGGFSSYMNSGLSNNFQFEFPRFGVLPGSHFLDKNNTVSAAVESPTGDLSQQGSHRRSSLKENATSSSIRSPGQPATDSKPSVYGEGLPYGSKTGSPLEHGSASSAARERTGSSSTQTRVFQFQGASSTSNSNSPTASSVSQYGPNSSCGTSPEPSNNSPAAAKALDNAQDAKPGYVCHGNSEGEVTFCEKLNMACGNPRNPIPRALSMSNATLSPAPATAVQSPAINTAAHSSTRGVTDVNGIDYLATQNGGHFDPSLFGDYRESQAAIVGDGDFTNGFFNDAFSYPDFGSPFHLGDTPAVQKLNPLEEIEKQQDGLDDEVVPGEDTTRMLNCHKIWDKLSSRPDFKDGSIDIDSLCSELRAKARCSESGVVVDDADVEAALQRLPEKGRTASGSQVA